MSPGPAEEATKALGSVTEALKSTPVVLAILLFNLVFIGVIAWSSYENGRRWERMMETAFKQCGPIK